MAFNSKKNYWFKFAQLSYLFLLLSCEAEDGSLSLGDGDTSNSPPNANAGANQNVTTGSIVLLNGSESNDPDGDNLTYSWILTVPVGSNAELNLPENITPSFTVDLDGEYTASLIVNDGVSSSQSDNVTIISSSGNSVPVANAGIDQNVSTSTIVTLNGSNSTDADGDNLTFFWVLSVPVGSNAVLSSPISVTPVFTADIDGAYVATLTVNDGAAISQSDNVVITSTTSNSVPVANAGIDQNVSTGDIVTLNGSNSSDADGDNLTFFWVLSTPVGSNAVLNATDSVTAVFTADIDGAYVATLTVYDGAVISQSDNVVVTSSTSNSAPVANAGIDQNVSTGDIVTLNGSNSTDADGDNLTFFWVLSTPVGSNAILTATNSVTPVFTTDIDGAYVATLTVFDGAVISQNDNVVVTSSTSNSAPVANAGSDQNVSTGSTVMLDASASSDSDGDSLFYSWVITTKPLASNTSLISENIVNPTFIADVDGEYIIGLTVNDGDLTSQSDSVLVTATTANTAPVANAGNDQNVNTGDLVMLDGSASNDLENDNLTFNWLLNVPVGSSASLNDNTSILPTFTADVDGTYMASLAVNDGNLTSQTDSVLIQSATPVSSDFDSFDGNGALLGYTTNNANDLPDVVRANGRYRANLVDNTNDKTLHFNNFQGRLDAKQVSFPFEVIARNIGIGTQSDSQASPSPNGSQFIFAGVQIHVVDLNSRNSSHVVVGHRGGVSLTIEGKHTVNASSSVDDAGTNVAPDGRADLRIVGNADRSLTVYWQQPNLTLQPDNWQLYRGSGALPGNSPSYGASVYVGLITYAQGFSNIPFVGTCDSFEIIQ